MSTALLWAGIIIGVGLGLLVWGNDEGSATEVALLEGTSVSTPLECDAMYHAIWRVKQEPSHTNLISVANKVGCPFEYPLEWTP